MNKHTIGTKWKDRNEHDCTVFDIYTTISSAGCIVREEYVSYHMFMGQRVEHIDTGVTVARGVARLHGNPV